MPGTASTTLLLLPGKRSRRYREPVSHTAHQLIRHRFIERAALVARAEHHFFVVDLCQVDGDACGVNEQLLRYRRPEPDDHIREPRRPGNLIKINGEVGCQTWIA